MSHRVAQEGPKKQWTIPVTGVAVAVRVAVVVSVAVGVATAFG